MRRPSHKNSRNDRPQRSRVAQAVRVTNEEILGDLLYPAPATRVGARQRKAHRCPTSRTAAPRLRFRGRR